ncbi:hypothetical protein [Pseudonocardia yunnanensis]|uniref:Uncharacterized protein n=1 Tax=Pseudonocardia yunnanensis TaxID=58107 RepID=A0ABW4ES93_9PSEU
MSRPYFSSAAGETIIASVPCVNAGAKTVGNSPIGSVNWNLTVSGSTTDIDLIGKLPLRETTTSYT